MKRTRLAAMMSWRTDHWHGDRYRTRWWLINRIHKLTIDHEWLRLIKVRARSVCRLLLRLHGTIKSTHRGSVWWELVCWTLSDRLRKERWRWRYVLPLRLLLDTGVFKVLARFEDESLGIPLEGRSGSTSIWYNASTSCDSYVCMRNNSSVETLKVL